MLLQLTILDMKRTANIATTPKRESFLKVMLTSIISQFDEIRIYANEFDEIPYWMTRFTVVKGENLYDNGKFYFLSKLKEPEYYFSLDDDIIYPSTYVDDMVNAIHKHNTIVTQHGRLLLNSDVSYYRGHKAFHCCNNNFLECEIDVAGTGVTAFSTEYFNPNEIYKSTDVCMSDLVFSLEAIKQNKKITVLTHDCGYIKALPVPFEETIFGNSHKREHRQIEIANEIFMQKNK